MQISVVIPLYNEEDSLIELHEKIISNLENFLIDYEIIFIWSILPWYLGSDFFPQLIKIKIINKKEAKSFI